MDGSENSSLEYKKDFFLLLDEIDLRIGRRLENVVVTLNDAENFSYLFFIRITEIFQAILTLIKTDQVIPAKILLRSLAETFILMKASMRDPDFNNRHIKNAICEKESWIKKTIIHLPKSGFKQDAAYFEKMNADMQELQTGLDKRLQQTYQLFCDLDEHLLYLNVYAPSSLFTHGNRQSFNIYYSEGGVVRPVVEREYRSLCTSATFSSARIMCKAYELACELFKIDLNLFNEIESLTEQCAAKYHKGNEN
jgi:hypothetical protein